MTSKDAARPGPSAPRARVAAVVATGLWVVVAAALGYGIWETAQKVAALFGG